MNPHLNHPALRGAAKALFAVVLSVASLSEAAGETPREARNMDVLAQVMETLNRNHYRSDFAAHWADAVKQSTPEIRAARGDAELAERINRLLHSFGDSHLNLLAPPSEESVSALTRAPGVPHGRAPGVKLGEFSGRIRVLSVAADTPAAAAGVVPGLTVAAVNGVPLEPEKASVYGWASIGNHLLQSVLPDGKIHLRSADGTERAFVPGAVAPVFQVGAMPPLRLEYASRRLAGGKVGLIAFNAFTPEIVGRVRRDVEGPLRDCEALILDLRGNAGGLVFLCENLAGWVSPREIPFGSIVMRDIPVEPVSWPQKRGFKGRLAVLIDRDSYSTAEAFAAGVQDAKAGIVVGTRSAGMCLPSSFLTLRHGFILQTVMGDFRRAGGKRLERLGVEPDFPPLPERENRVWRDPATAAALVALGYPEEK